MKDKLINELKSIWEKILQQEKINHKLIEKELHKLSVTELKEMIDEAGLELYHLNQEINH